MDTVFIRDLRLHGKHGVGEKERQVEQEFLIDIEAEFDTAKAAKSDALTDTLDYVVFAKIAKEVVERNSFYLIERLAEAIAEGILSDTRTQGVAVTVRKPSVLESGVPGVRIYRNRA